MPRCFVYGSLRPGQYNLGRLGGHVGQARRATTEGQLFHFSEHRRLYPVALLDRDGTIVGDVLEFEEQQWQDICDMELGAGYELWTVEVCYEDGTVEHLHAFHYAYEPEGRRIPSGDWLNDDDEDFDAART